MPPMSKRFMIPIRLSVLAVGSLVFSASLTTSVKADEVHLKGGNSLEVTILERFNDRIVVHHVDLGRLEIARDRIVSIVIEPGLDEHRTTHETSSHPSSLGAIQDNPAPGKAPAPGIEPTPEPVREWQSQFTLGLSGSFGNTDTQSFNVGITSVRTRDDEIASFDLSYYYGATNGDREDNRFSTGLRNDWLVPDSPWRLFAQGRFDADEFQSWDHRVGVHVGPGYLLVDQEDVKLTVRVGLGVIKEFGSIDEDLRPEALFGADLAWSVSKKQTFTLGTTIFPDLEETGEFRAVTNINWSLLLDDQRNMSVTAGLFHEYQSDVDPSVDKNDLKIFAGLKFDF